MGLLSWPFGGESQQSIPIVSLKGPGTYSLEVVGESHYQSALDSICGGRTEDGHDMIVEARLIHEDDNPYDDKAIRVEINGETVGYLNRANARQYRKKLNKAGYPGMDAICSAKIVGGWDRGGDDKGHFGVRLDVPTEEAQIHPTNF